MYTNQLLTVPALLLALSLALSFKALNVEAQPLTGTYPPVDVPPPPVASWTALVDQSKLPPAPVNPPVAVCNATDPYCYWTCTTCTRPASDISYTPKAMTWGLTYDDGPTNNTVTVLNALAARGLKATFFVIGSRVYENPQILQQVVNAGHQIGVHTWSHTALTSQTTEEIIAEAKWTEKAIQQAVNLTPKYFRAPMGDCDDRVRGILTQLGYKIAFWDHDTFDWESNSDPTYNLNWIPANFSIWVQNTTSPLGFITLEHDAFTLSSSMTPQAMDIVLNAKFSVAPLAVLLGDSHPYVENVQLTGSSIQAANATASTTTTGSSSSTPKSGSSSIEKNVPLSITIGFILIIFGFVGTISL